MIFLLQSCSYLNKAVKNKAFDFAKHSLNSTVIQHLSINVKIRPTAIRHIGASFYAYLVY